MTLSYVRLIINISVDIRSELSQLYIRHKMLRDNDNYNTDRFLHWKWNIVQRVRILIYIYRRVSSMIPLRSPRTSCIPAPWRPAPVSSRSRGSRQSSWCRPRSSPSELSGASAACSKPPPSQHSWTTCSQSNFYRTFNGLMESPVNMMYGNWKT